jgi:hypothetical protein
MRTSPATPELIVSDNIFVFRTCETLNGPNEYRVDLTRVQGHPELWPHEKSDREYMLIRFTDGTDSGECWTSRVETGRFRAALAEYRSRNPQ